MRIISQVIVVLILTSMLFPTNLVGQKFMYDKNFEKAEKFIYKSNYLEALPLLLAMDSLYDDPLIDFYIGMTFYESESLENKAIPYFEKYVLSSDSLDQAHFYLAQLYHWNYRFDDAIKMYEKFSSIVNAKINDDDVIALINDKIDKNIAECGYGKLSVDNPRKVIIENLGEEINTKFSEYGPVVSGDEKELIFTSRRNNSTGLKLDYDHRYFEDIYYADLIKGSLFSQVALDTLLKGGGYITLLTDFEYALPRKMWGGVNSKKHDGAIQYNNTEDSLYFYRGMDIWVSEIKDSASKTLPSNVSYVNSSAYEPSIYFSPDGTFFIASSDRSGGYGGLDLYESRLLADGSWGELVNLGPKINTRYDEDAPYIDPDMITVYFASKGHTSMGGYDVFKTRRTVSDGWSDAINMGYPINTPGDEIYYVMTPKYNRAYYSSDNLQGYGDMDLYRVTFADERHPMAELKGLVLEHDEYRPAKSEITIFNEGKEKFSTFSSDSTTGEYLVLLGHGKKYEMLVETEGFLPYTKSFLIPEQKEYYQLYQEIHHIYIRDSEDNILGQQIVVFNSLDNNEDINVDNNVDNDTTNLMYDSRTIAELERIKGLRNDNKVEVLSDVKFYITRDSLMSVLIKDKSLQYSFPTTSSFSFLSDSTQSKDSSSSYSTLANNFVEDLFNRKSIYLDKVDDVEDLEKSINNADLSDAPLITLHFKYDKAIIVNEDRENINILINYLEKHPKTKVEVVGHTDSNGDEKYNQKLSELRSKQIYEYLKTSGISKSRMITRGVGESEPIAPNTGEGGIDNPEGRALNRRVEFKLFN
jgi:outer membrane protein OmpA-like peptidoglycan-associated protein